MLKKLNRRHKLFAKYYLTNGFNATQAYLRSFKCENSTAQTNSAELMKDEKVKAYISDIAKTLDVSEMIDTKYICDKLLEVVEKSFATGKYSATEACLRLLSQLKGLTKTDVSVTNTIVNAKDIDSIKQSLANRDKGQDVITQPRASNSESEAS